MGSGNSTSGIHLTTPQRGHRPVRALQLAVIWDTPSDVFWSSVRALIYGPAPPRGWPQGPFFRDAWVRTNFPTKALLASVLWHIFLFNINVPYGFWFKARPRGNQEYPRIEVTWYTPPWDLKPLAAPSLPAKKARRPSPPGVEKKTLPPKGADAFHPRQLIVSAPALPTHPRQTLIQPDSPLEAPKILPALPNIVQWNEPVKLARPKLTLKYPRLRRTAARRPLPEAAAPELIAEQRLAGVINIAPARTISIPRPKLTIAATAMARAGKRNESDTLEPAPELAADTNGGQSGAKNLIALSANPAPPAPNVQVPPGNLSARVIISPEGTQPGVPGGSTNGTAGATGGAGGAAGSPGGMGTGTQSGAGTGPAGIIIVGGDPDKLSSSSGLGGAGSPTSRPERPIPASPRAERFAVRKTLPALDPPREARANPSPSPEPIKPGATPATILGPKRIYTMNVNAPNMASATGSWVLQFAELNESGNRTGPPLSLRTDPQSDLVGPVPMRKVDPKYPPALISARVQGDVILYAIIRKDGSVDSIQVVKGIEPRLDQNAMEAMARWKFRPAERRGEPVELEAVITIPFRAAARF